MKNHHKVFELFSLIVAVVLLLGTAMAQPATEPNSASPTATEISALQSEQKLLAERFAKLEELFIRMSELEAASNPTRSSLLQQAAQLSKQLATLQRLNLAVELLAKNQFSRAIQEQESTRESLGKLLELLQSENRQARIREDRAKIQALIKDVQRLEKLQRSLRGRTEAGQEKESAARDQQDIQQQATETDKALAEALGNDPATNDTEKPKHKPDNESPDASKEKEDSKPEDRSQKEKKPSEDQKSDDPKSESKKPDSSESESKGSKGSKSKPSKESSSDSKKSQDGTESQESDSDSSKPSAKSPPTREEKARERLKNAQQRMKKAQEQLQKEERQDAVDEQWAAEEELRLAAEELERILVQLREEEIERSLADLESRLRRMLEMQNRVLDQSKRLLSTAPTKGEDRQMEIQASKLSIDERKILMEGQKALLLLQDEGSSMAFPEAVQQMNEDIAWVVEAFSNAKINASTISTEEEIIAALEEMIESLTETQKKMEEKKKKNDGKSKGAGGGGGDQEQPLVDELAELRLIKTLQLRINGRTQRLAKDSGQTDDPTGAVEDSSIRDQLRELAERQDKIQGVTRDILLEQTKK